MDHDRGIHCHVVGGLSDGRVVVRAIILIAMLVALTGCAGFGVEISPGYGYGPRYYPYGHFRGIHHSPHSLKMRHPQSQIKIRP